MKRIILTILAVTFTLPAQKIENETPARDKLVRVQTALNHLTVIEVAEPVTTVAVGSPEAFKVERREIKVFIQPLEEHVATNLFIWTATTRLNYELVPAVTDASQMVLAIDYRQAPRSAEARPVAPPAKAAGQSELPAEVLSRSTPVKLVGFSRSKQPPVGITIRDLYRTENQLFIRYTVENRSKSPYRPSTPSVVSLRSPHCDPSLMSLSNSQLGDMYSSHLNSDGIVAVPIVHAETTTAEILPGADGVGVVAVQLRETRDPQSNTTPVVLRMIFPSDGSRQVIATLVL